ncbi:cysteine proteinase [Amniculicola lignicola CBS 123094]|uniref:ubiquitinyl hydrolase 1 n=1 Tax=Amniculicola lignicola CBS 123094 TaxID=1392246 RepID=A0A6A5WRV9_9PLEO|nr:cysteine proteinase [Amniculicola lignicola CBS 123094]
MASDDELAQLEKLSNEWEPEPQGPLVGERKSSSAITVEYANADPIYRIKTAALPQKYAFFRTCRGDGHCGWRAVAFGYYEALLRGGDANKLEEEVVRLRSMNNLLNSIGFQEDLYEDFADEVYELLRRLAASLRAMDGTTAALLLEAFNDMGRSMAIITYLKLLASAWLQNHEARFADFIIGYPSLKAYCQHNIEAAQCEMDHLAMQALAECVVKAGGLALEVLYLDRSEGTEISPYREVPENVANPPTIRILYRPGHYDILYKAEDFAPPAQQQPIPTQPPLQVALAGYTEEFVPMASHLSDVMTLIPGMYPPALGQRWPSLSYDYNSSPAPVPTYAPAPTPAAPVTSSHQDFASPVHASYAHHGAHSHHGIHLEPPVTLPIHPPPPMSLDRGPPLTLERTAPVERGGPFRPSVYELEPGFGGCGQPHAMPFQTSIFRNSHYNTAHFLNPDFQPEEWSPDTEYATGNRGRHKSTSQ